MQNIYDKLFKAQALTQQESQYLFNAIIQGELTEAPIGRRINQHENAW
ncbi:bifunctional glutamine amidotransferase/anthranilate phosphoribosyltransferase [Providencia rustigianii]|nr:bifunctional glutamine amidotransferase/anthranilate phosphoribosyltransferase [Providencia rustigianii]